MKAYIAGPMTGLPRYNAAEFGRVAEQWRAKGWSVTTPFDTNNIVWRAYHGRDFDPSVDKCEYGHPLLAEMYLLDLNAALGADAIVLLDGWMDSRGATREVAVAHLFGKSFYMPNGRVVEVTPKMTFDIHPVIK